MKKYDAIKKAIRECDKKNNLKNFDKCLIKKGFKIEPIRPSSFRRGKTEIREIREAIRRLRRLRGL